MIIRDAVEADLAAIVEIYNAAIKSRISTAQLESVSVAERLPWFREHSPHSFPLWVSEIDHEIVGWLSLHRFIARQAYRPTAEIGVYVNEKFRRRGVAREMIEKAVNDSSHLELTALVGCIFSHNEPSLCLFTQMGFERWGFLPGIANVDGILRDLVIVGRQTRTGLKR